MIIKRLAFEPVLVKHLEALGIDHRPVTADPAFRTLDRQRRLYRLALFAKRMTGDELLGLRIGRKVPVNSYGPLSHAIMGAPTPRHVLQLTIKYMHMFQSHPSNAAMLGNGPETASFEYRHPKRLKGFPSFVPDLFFASNLRTLEQLGADLAGSHLEVDYEPSDCAAFRAELGVPVTFSARRNRLVIPLAAIDAPLPGNFSEFSRAHGRLAENILASLSTEEGLHDRVVEILTMGREAPPRAADIAAALHMSERTLRRKLSHMGLSYTELLAELRAELARAYLLEMPVRDVAELLGYCDASTFRRAFRRWTGATPSAFLAGARFVGVPSRG
jgi:AraC-like DNA-binding protein